MSTAAPMPKRGLPAKVALSTGVLALALLVADGGVRVWTWCSGAPYSSASTEATIREVLSAMTSALPTSGEEPGDDTDTPGDGTQRKGLRYRLHPYTGFALDAGLARTERTVDFYERDDPDRPYTVFVQGGSVASIFAGGQHGGAARLIERLEADPALEGRKVVTVRLAVPGYKQPQQLLQLTYLLARGCDPDMVLNLDGLNEVRIGADNARSRLQPTWPSLTHWTGAMASAPGDDVALDMLVEMRALQGAVRREAQTALDRHYAFSAILGKLTLSRLTRSRAQWASAQTALVERQAELGRRDRDHAFGVPADEEDAVAESVRCWFESSLAMHQLCSARGIRYVHALQPTLHDEGSKPITDEERRKGVGENGFNPAVVEGYPLMREGLAELRRLGVEALDMSLAFEGLDETVYYDSCHFGALGCRTLADRIVDAMRR